MSVAKLKSHLLRSLDAYLTPLEFHRVSDRFYGDRYCRDDARVRLCVHVSTRARDEALEAELPYISVRFNAVEDMVASLEESHPLTTPAGIAARATLTVPTSSWGGFFRKTWVIRSQDDLANITDQIATYAMEKGLPVFETLSNPEQALRVLAADDETARSYAGPEDVRAKKAVALAFLVHGQEAAKQIGIEKSARLTGEGLSTFTLWMERLLRSFSAATPQR